MNNNTPSDENYERLQRLMDGNTRKAESITYQRDPFTRFLKKAPLIGLALVFAVYTVYIGIQYFQTRPNYSYNVNPISKIVLKYKALEYVEDNYPEFSEDADVNINNGIVKYKNGYMVTCKGKEHSIVSVYFNKWFQPTHDSSSVIKKE